MNDGMPGNQLVPMMPGMVPVLQMPGTGMVAGARPPGFAERWQAFKRQRKSAMWAGLGVLGLVALITVLWPATYRSTGTILIEQQEMPLEMVPSTITSFADQRVQVISERVMTADNLMHIIERYDLYPRVRAHEPREVLIERMRKDIDFEMVSADVMDPRQGRATKADIAFTVSFDSRSPGMAARVANELVSLYLDENVRSRRQQTADAAKFLDEQSHNLSKQIDAELAQIASFKSQHINTLPEQAMINESRLTRDQDELRDVEMQLRSLDQQIIYYGGQLVETSPSSQVYTSTGERVLSPNDRLKFLRTEEARVSGVYGPNHPDVLRIQREIAGLEKVTGNVDSSNDLQRQLEDARTQLADVKQRYSPEHPDVIRLQKKVDDLTQQIAQAGAKRTPLAPVANADNPVYVQIRTQKEAAEGQRSSLLAKRAELVNRIGETENHLAASPSTERDYAHMMSTLESDQLRYREIEQKRLEANLAQNLEDEQKGERFTLIDPPTEPEVAHSPKRALLFAVGLVLALGAAIGVALSRDNSDPTVRHRGDLEQLLMVPPLAILPIIESTEDHARAVRIRWITISCVVATVVVALLLVNFLYKPLDVIWEVAWRKLG